MPVLHPPMAKLVTSITLARRASGRMGLRLGVQAWNDAALGAHGHGDAEMSARELAVYDLDGTAVRGYELQHHRQADAGAFHRRALGGAAGVESLEHVLAILGRDTGAVVGHIEYEPGSRGAGFQVNGAALG